MASAKEGPHKKGQEREIVVWLQLPQTQSHVLSLHQVLGGGSKPAVLILHSPRATTELPSSGPRIDEITSPTVPIV